MLAQANGGDAVQDMATAFEARAKAAMATAKANGTLLKPLDISKSPFFKK